MILIVLWILCGVFSASIASGKGHGGCSWFIGGFLFGPLALIATLGLRDLKRDGDTRRLLDTQEEMLDEIQRKHNWERRQWEQERERQYLDTELRQPDLYILPPEDQSDWEVAINDEEEDFINVIPSVLDPLEDYLHTLEYDEDVPGLLENLHSLKIHTKEDFLNRLALSVKIVENFVVEEMFAEHIWIQVLNKASIADYQAFWDNDLCASFLVIKTQDNAYFLKKINDE